MYTIIMVTLFVACKALIQYKDLFLVIRESSKYKDGTNTGKWDVPGGRIKPGEQWKEALKREVLEEVGLEISIKTPVHTDEWFPIISGKQSQVIATYYNCTAKSNLVTLSADHEDYAWLTQKELAALPLVSGVKAAIEGLI